MKEFIVWDDMRGEFTKDVTYFMSFNADGSINSFNGFGDTKYFPYIGLTDIENKKIYADSSIVEFEDYAQRPHCGYGVIKFKSLIEPYIETRFIDVDGKPTDEIYYLKLDVSVNLNSFKIIDTIQEREVRNANCK